MRTEPERSLDRYGIRAVERAVRVLRVVARSSGPHDVSSIGVATGLHAATAFRLVRTLLSLGLLVEDERAGLRIGPLAFEIGSSFLRGGFTLSRPMALVEQLAEATGETANLGILDQGDVLYLTIAHGQSELGIQSQAGTRHPAYCTALGKVLLAGLGWERAEPLLAAADRRSLTANTIVDIDELRAELSRVAELGYAVDDEERVHGVRCAAAPIRDATGGVVAALSVAGPAFRLEARFTSAIAAVRDVAASASASLGYSDFAHHAVGNR